MDKEEGMSDNKQIDEGSAPSNGQQSSTTRRRFNTGAAAGAAVLLTLGNRGAWGSHGFYNSGSNDKSRVKVKTACISQQVWASYANGDPSFDPNGKFKAEVSKFEGFLEKYDGRTIDRFTDGTKTCAKVEVSTTSGSGGWRR